MTASEPDSPEHPDRASGETDDRASGETDDGNSGETDDKSERARNQLPDPSNPVDWAQRLASGTWIGVCNRPHLADPRAGLQERCEFLGVEADQKYLDDCANVVWPSASLPRRKVVWNDQQIDRVLAIIDRYEGMHEYSFAR